MTTDTTRGRLLAGPLIALVLIVFAAPWMSGVAWAQTGSFFVSFTDANGAPVTDLRAEEVVVEMDGEHGETLNLEPINWPVRVTVFIDNGIGTRPALDDMREGVSLFVDTLPPDVEVAIATIGGRPQFWAEHTTNRQELTDAIGVTAPVEGAAFFFDALYEEAERLDEDEEGQYFPVIVMVATNGPEGSNRVREGPFNEMMQRLFANSATLHTRLLSGSSITGVKQGGDQIRWGTDIGDATGGTYQGLVSANGYRTLLPELAEAIGRKHNVVSNQYRVTYAPPDGISEQPSVRILTTRAGVNMAPTLDGNVNVP